MQWLQTSAKTDKNVIRNQKINNQMIQNQLVSSKVIILYIYILYIYYMYIYIYNPRGHSTPPSWEWPLSAWSIWKTTVASDSQQSPAPGYSQGIQSSKFYTSWGSWGPGQPRGSPGFCPGARRGANPAKNWQKDGRRSNNSKWGVALMVGKLVKNYFFLSFWWLYL